MRKLFTLTLALLASFSLTWGAGTALSDLNFSGLTALPSAYTYSSSNSPAYSANQGPSGDKRNCVLVGNGGKGQTPTISDNAPTGGKRWMAFCPAEDCNVEITCYGNTKVFKMFDKGHNIAAGNVDTISVYLSSYTGTSEWSTWSVTGLKGGKWYVISASSSSSYIASMQFTSTESPVCPLGLSISGKNAYTEGAKIELTAALEEGNGNITYQWYKGGIAEGNKITGATTTKLEIEDCTSSDAGDYYCVASKADCADASNAEAYAVTVKAIEPTGDATITYTGSQNTVAGAATGVNSISGLSTAIELSNLTYNSKKTLNGYFGSFIGMNEESSVDEAKYIDLKFVLADGYIFTPSEVSILGQTNNSTGAAKAVVRVLDAHTSVESSAVTVSKSSDGAIAQFAAGAFDGKQFEGTIHLRIFLYGAASDKTVYLKSPITIAGTVAVAPTKYNVTFDKNGGSGDDMPTLKYAEGAEVTLPACTFNAPTGKEFDAWTSSDVTISDNKFTMPAKDVTITATWKTAITRYTVTYKDGESTLGTEEVEENGTPAEYAQYQNKSLYSFAGWYDNSGLTGDAIDPSAATITEDITYYAKFEKVYASSINIEALILANGKSYNTKAQLGTLHYASNYSSEGMDISNDSLNNGKGAYRNYDYLGLKVKSVSLLNFRIANGKTVKMKFGDIKTTPQVSINGGDYAAITINDGVYTHTADAEEVISFKVTEGNKAVVLKQIVIGDAPELEDVMYPISYAATTNGTVSGWTIALPGETVTLTLTPASGYRVASVKVNDGDPLTVTDNKASFEMPAAAVNVVAAFELATALDNTADEIKAVKFFENGQLFIRRGEKVYTITGEEVK